MPITLEATQPSQTVTSRSQWLAARTSLLEKEKQYTHLRDELLQLRRQLPWVKVEKAYSFESPCGTCALADLFGDKSQLLVYHFMFAPEWPEGCPGCSLVADHLNGVVSHITQRDISLMLVSRAPLEKINAFKQRMGWTHLHWVSSGKTDFNQDLGVTFDEKQAAAGGNFYNYSTQPFPAAEAPGMSAFAKQGGEIFHTYSTYARGLENLLGMYGAIDMAPKGRNEGSVLPHPMAWVRHHDKYPHAAPQRISLNVGETPNCNCH